MTSAKPDFTTPLAQAGYPLIRSIERVEDLPPLPLTESTERANGLRWVSSWSGDKYSDRAINDFIPGTAPKQPLIEYTTMIQSVRQLMERSGKLLAVNDAVARYFAEANQNATASYMAQGQQGTGQMGELWYLELWLVRAHVYAQMLYWLTGDHRWDAISDDYLQTFSLVSGSETKSEQP